MERGAPALLRTHLERDLASVGDRALVAVLVCPPAARAAVDQVIDESLPPSTERLHVDGGEACRQRLVALNQQRDLVMQSVPAVLLVVSDAGALREVRRWAPDLTAAPDLWFEVEVEGEGDGWGATRDALVALMRARHSSLDLTGLLPATALRHTLPLAEIYLPLVKIPRPEPGKTGSPALVLLAHPGAGKTIWLRHLASEYASAGSDPLDVGGGVPLLVPLAEYAGDRSTHRLRPLREFPGDWLVAQGVAGSLVEGEVVLLLDGLDELRSEAGRGAVLRELVEAARERRFRAIVLTGRSFLAKELAPFGDDLTMVSVRSPDGAEVERFLRAFARLWGHGPDHAERLAARIRADSDLRALARTPLVLAFLALLHEVEGRLPDRRVEIYWRLGEMLVDRWSLARSLANPEVRATRATRGDALRVLGPLAWWVVERGGAAVSSAELESELVAIESRRERREVAEARARALLELLRHDTALLVPQPGDRWAFVHPQITEYFAAVGAVRMADTWEGLLAHPFRAEWREVVLFAASVLGTLEGRDDQLEELVRAILTVGRSSYDARHPSLLVGLLSEQPGLSTRQISALVDRVLRFMLVNKLPTGTLARAQKEVVSYLRDAPARGGGPAVGDGLRRWFRPRPVSRIRWEWALRTSSWSAGAVVPVAFHPEQLSRKFEEDYPVRWEEADGYALCDIAPPAVGGPLLAALPNLLVAHGIDAEPLLAMWLGHDDWRLRAVAWHIMVTRTPADARDALAKAHPERAAELGVLLSPHWVPPKIEEPPSSA